MSGMFTPFVELYGKFFSEEMEPQFWDSDFKKLCNNYYNGKNKPIRSLNYFYDLEKYSRKKIINIRDVKHFIDDDPYNDLAGFMDLDITKPKTKTLYIYKPGTEPVIKINDAKHKKPKKQRKPRKASSKTKQNNSKKKRVMIISKIKVDK